MSVQQPGSARHAAAAGARPRPLLVDVLLWIAAAGLIYDAFSHYNLAYTYDHSGGTITQGDLFRIEALLASIAAVLIFAVPRKIVWFLAFLLAAGGLAALLLYRYVDVGPLGPLPNMYEPAWYPEKTWSAISMGVAAIALLILLLYRAPAEPAAQT